MSDDWIETAGLDQRLVERCENAEARVKELECYERQLKHQEDLRIQAENKAIVLNDKLCMVWKIADSYPKDNAILSVLKDMEKPKKKVTSSIAEMMKDYRAKIEKIESAWQDSELRAEKAEARVEELVEATLKTLVAQAMYVAGYCAPMPKLDKEDGR